MLPRERVLAALRREPVDRVPYVETSIGLRIGEKLLGQTLPLVQIPQLGLNLRHGEDDKRLSRLLHRDNISVRLIPPTFSKKEKGKEGQLFVGDGLIKTMDDFRMIDTCLQRARKAVNHTQFLFEFQQRGVTPAELNGEPPWVAHRDQV